MTVPPIDLNAIMLAAQVTKVLNVIHRVAYALISPNLQVLYASPNFTTVVSEPTNHIFGRPIQELLWEFVGAEDSLRAVLNGTKPFLAFERVNREMPDGRLIYLDINITPINNPELENGLLLIVEDVTDQAKMEQGLTQHRNELLLVKEQLSEANIELQQLNKFKSLFLSMAAHDLRTPLTTIRAYSDLMLRLIPADTPPKISAYTEIIQKQAVRMDWLINDFLDLDSVEQGKLVLRPEENDLNDTVSQVVSMLAYIAEKRQQTLSLHLWPNGVLLAFDENRLQQILYNLVNNAIKYTPQAGSIVVS
ncbi:MAG: PAS domain-containing protein, partial [Anaerolineae bacterium]|nr:PAS domain-containing protein [Anaerolineae bacterium]